LCLEQCRIYHSTAIPGILHICYYSLLVAVSDWQSWEDKGSCQGLGVSGWGLFEGKPILPLYACIQVEQLLKSSYENNEIDIPTADGKSYLGECVGSTILWHKRDIVLHGAQPIATPDLFSVKTHRRAATSNTRSREATGTAGGPWSLGQRPRIQHTTWRLSC
jgi:hypothetical protein